MNLSMETLREKVIEIMKKNNFKLDDENISKAIDTASFDYSTHKGIYNVRIKVEGLNELKTKNDWFT